MKEYYDILNRRKPMEEVGDAFKGQADSMRPMNVGQRREQALMRGFGAGINMGARAIDEAKIREIEEGSRQTAMLDRELKMASSKNQLREQKIKSFIADQDSNLKLASDLIVKGKYDQLDILAPSIFNAYKEHTGTNLGEYLFSKNGHISFKTPAGKIETMEAKTLFNPIMNYIPPEDRGNYKGFATSYQAEELDAIVEARRLKNELLQSQADNMKAHSKLYESQAKEVKLSDYDKVVLAERKDERKAITDLNNKYITDLGEKNTKAKEMKSVITEFRKVFTENDSGFGSSKWDEFIRGARKITGTDAALQRAEYLRKYYFPEIKGIAGNPNQKEWVDLTSKIVSASHNKEAVLQELSYLEDRYNQDIENYDATAEVLASTGNKVYYYDPQFSSMVEESKANKKARIRVENINKNLELGVTVKMKDKTGTIFYIPKEKVNESIKDGLEIYE